MAQDDTRVSEQEKAQLSKRRGQAAALIVDPDERRRFISAQGDAEAVNKGELPVAKAKKMSEEAGLMGYKKGTSYVPKTGAAVVHKGERIVSAEKNNPMGLAEAALAHPDAPDMAPKKAPKEIKEIRTRKATNGGYIHEHHHTSFDHPMEEHTSANTKDMLDHMKQNMGGSDEAEDGKVLGSFQDGGTVPKTGNYKLHEGEKVTPAGSSISDYFSKAKALLSPTVEPSELGEKAKNIAQYTSKAKDDAKPAPSGVSDIDRVNKPGVPTNRDRLIKPLD